ncbi:hypothetical protein J5U23_01706 [Saccharolobus shibatae B12]|uniref:Uncharacterized protein n=1 Tax=Saccharolobus shibatae (strain ATCC 51178 / DSM 5389 / JCM 8931 / NBRC 15437 / B12) TaxID=523848 RepID=A0A8F5BP32_SACSH|nr:hypothetical protein J5U23_01706 [Saccharolobus shibatae B12]
MNFILPRKSRVTALMLLAGLMWSIRGSHLGKGIMQNKALGV